LKIYYAQIGQDSRVIRQISEEKTKLKQQTEKMQSLLDAEDLLARNELNIRLEEANKKVQDLQQLCRVI
jgi:hypothetical protein